MQYRDREKYPISGSLTWRAIAFRVLVFVILLIIIFVIAEHIPLPLTTFMVLLRP